MSLHAELQAFVSSLRQTKFTKALHTSLHAELHGFVSSYVFLQGQVAATVFSGGLTVYMHTDTCS